MEIRREGHEYILEPFEKPEKAFPQPLIFVRMDEKGEYHPGTTNEEVLAMMIDRMKYLNKEIPCRESAIVITKLEESLMWLNYRTTRRAEQGVEGKHLPHKS